MYYVVALETIVANIVVTLSKLVIKYGSACVVVDDVAAAVGILHVDPDSDIDCSLDESEEDTVISDNLQV